MGKPSSTKITSSNRFEKLDPDIDCESSSAVMAVSTSTSLEDVTQGSAVPTSSNSGASVKGSEDRKPGTSSKDKPARSGRGSGRRGGSVRHTQEVNGPANASGSTEELEGEEKVSREDSMKKKRLSNKHIKFDASSHTESSNRQDSAYFSTGTASLSSLSIEHEDKSTEDPIESRSPEDGVGDRPNENKGDSSGVEDSNSSDQQANQQKRIVYERVSFGMGIPIKLLVSMETVASFSLLIGR